MASLLVVVLLSLAASIKAQNYTDPGPYSLKDFDWNLDVIATGRSYSLSIKVTYPTDVANDFLCPVVFFYSGFLFRASWYSFYTQRLASWGYVVIQYDAPLLTIIPDETEILFFHEILRSVKNNLPQEPVPKNVDFNSLVMGGHSRGAKLASLIALENWNVSALVLIDPVNGDGRNSPSPENGYPDAVAMLKGKNVTMMIAGSSVSGWISDCTPPQYNYTRFWDVSGQGSWLTVIANAGHAQFLDASFMQMFWNGICGAGRISSKTVMETTAPFVIAWLESTFRPPLKNVDEMNNKNPMDEFYAWVDAEQDSGRLKFEIKEHEAMEHLSSPSTIEGHDSVEL